MTGLDIKLGAGGKGGVKDRLLAGELDGWIKVPLMGSEDWSQIGLVWMGKRRPELPSLYTP